MRWLIVSIIVAIIISIFFFTKSDEKVVNRIQQTTYSTPNEEEIASSDRYTSLRMGPDNTSDNNDINLIKKDIEFINYRIEKIEDKIYNQQQNNDNIERLAKAASPIFIPIITCIVGWYKKRKKTEKSDYML